MAIIKYDGGGKPGGTVKESISHDGGKTWSSGGSSTSGYSYGTNSGGSIVSSSSGQKVTNSSGSNSSSQKMNGSSSSGSTQTAAPLDTVWQNYTGATGKQYSVAGSNGTISVTQTDGTQRYVRPTDADYNTTYNAMVNDLKGAGISYTPTHTIVNSAGKTITTKDYTRGNADLQYALQQAVKNNGGQQVGTADYVKSLWNQIGTQRQDGSIVTMADINNELNRLGLSDYNSDNVILTVGGTVLPGNEFVKQHTGADGSNSADSLWVTYGGQDYLLGGDSANWAQYVNGKTGKLTGIDYIFGDLNHNPYAQQDQDFLSAYNAAKAQYQSAIGNVGSGMGSGSSTSFTGNANVDNVINLINSQNSYAQATGGTGTSGSDILAQIEALLSSGKDAYSEFIAAQKQQAQDAATQQARQAWVNSRQAQRQIADALSAQGLGTSGAVQQSQLGIQNDYSSNLNTINSTLSQALNSLSGQELQLLSDYYSNMANYAYQYNDAEANRAIQREQLALQQQQAAWEQQYQQQQLALQQQAYEQQLKEYQDSLADKEYNKKLQQASQYQSMYDMGMLSDAGLINALSNLGLVSSGYWPNGSYTSGATTAQMERQLAAAQLQAALAANAGA